MRRLLQHVENSCLLVTAVDILADVTMPNKAGNQTDERNKQHGQGNKAGQFGYGAGGKCGVVGPVAVHPEPSPKLHEIATLTITVALRPDRLRTREPVATQREL